ncbi:MAG: hypothetical protein H0U19_14395 [Acidobacteria bacterium]|nr:hypothetical protein [Acidobacteriota bacterium]
MCKVLCGIQRPFPQGVFASPQRTLFDQSGAPPLANAAVRSRRMRIAPRIGEW